MIPFVTTKKQSETIISCGVDPITADLSYIVFPNGHLQYYVGQHKMQATNFCIDGFPMANRSLSVSQRGLHLHY